MVFATVFVNAIRVPEKRGAISIWLQVTPEKWKPLTPTIRQSKPITMYLSFAGAKVSKNKPMAGGQNARRKKNKNISSNTVYGSIMKLTIEIGMYLQFKG